MRDHAGMQFLPKVVAALEQLHSAGELHAETSSEELDFYAQGEYASRAVEEFLTRRGIAIREPSSADEPASEYPPQEISLPYDPGESGEARSGSLPTGTDGA